MEVMILRTRPNNMTPQEVALMNTTMRDHGYAHRANFCRPKTPQIYRRDYKSCRGILNPQCVERSTRAHFARKRQEMEDPLFVTIEKRGFAEGRFTLLPEKKPKVRGKSQIDEERKTDQKGNKKGEEKAEGKGKGKD